MILLIYYDSKPKQLPPIGRRGFTEIISSVAIQRMIETNKEISSKSGKSHSVNGIVLNEVIQKVNTNADIVDPRVRIAKKAANLLTGIAIKKPFAHGNFETGFIFMLNFIEYAGYDLSIESSDTLFEKIRKSVNKENEFHSEIESYLLNNLVEV